MFNSIADTMSNVTFQNDLANFIQRGFCRVDLRKDIFAGNIFVHHTVNGL